MPMRNLLIKMWPIPLAFFLAAAAQQPRSKPPVDDLAEQDSEEQDQDEEQPDQADPPPDQADQPGNAAAEVPGQVHTVVRGDTLWDLSQHYLGTPWYWPKVWSYNPAIANPHWIYPGNQVRFFGSGEEVPARVDAASSNGPSSPDAIDIEDRTEVQLTGRIGYQPSAAIPISRQG